MRIYFSDFFNISSNALEEYGAFDISLISDLPLFIDPFLLFNSEKAEYKQLHDEMIEYLEFLRDKSIGQALDDGTMKAWYIFKEVKQNWLGYSLSGNEGRGLGPDFAHALHDNFNTVFANFGDEDVEESPHLEKLTLVGTGVGRDNVSDFTTNLIKKYLLEYTQKFALANIDGSLLPARGRTTQKSWAVIRCAARPRWFPRRASSGRAQRDPRNSLPQTQQKAQKSGKHLPSTVFQLARRARTQQLAQNQAQVERAHVDQLPLQNVVPSAQMATPHPARFVTMCEAALDQLAAPPQ
jgi:hypothetical protein